MAAFQPSSYSPPSQPALANPAENVNGRLLRYVDVGDGGPGKWRVYSDGTAKLLSGYSNAGQVYPPGSQVLSNLIASPPGNKEKIEEILGVEATESQVATIAPHWPSGGGVSSVGTQIADEGLTSQPWFWPVVILGSTTLLAGGVLAYFYWTKPGQAKVRELRRTGHYVPELAS